jgi:TRAP-type C4-dicarboxylate transport system permease small subunit
MIFELYYRLLKGLLTGLMFLLLLPVSMQMLSRYTGLIPRYIWTEELARFCFIWIILVGSMVAVRDKSHFIVDLIPEPKTTRGKVIWELIPDFMMTCVAGIFIIWGWPLVQFGLIQQSEMSGLPMIYIYGAWPLAGATWFFFLIEKFITNLKTLKSSN